MNLLTSMAARDGVGQKMEQLTMRQSMEAGVNPVLASAASTTSNMTISASSRHAAMVTRQGGGACMMAGMAASSPTPDVSITFFIMTRLLSV